MSDATHDDMNPHLAIARPISKPRLVVTFSVLIALLSSNVVFAQDPPAPTTEEAPAPELPPEPAPPPPMDSPPPVEAPVVEPPAEVEPPPPPTSAAPTLKIGVGMRTGLKLLLNDPVTLTLSDGLADQANIRPYMAGSLTDAISFFTQFEIGTLHGLGNFAILDAIAQIKIANELQIWIGQHIPANDRNNMNGPFFANGWNFPEFVPCMPMDAGARDRGVTFWGLIADGLLKYQLSMVDLQPGRKLGEARYAGRITLDLLEPENMYYNSGTYYGGKDVLAIGLVGTYQKGSEGPMGEDLDNDYVAFVADLLFEKNLDTAGTVTLDAAYWNTDGTGPEYVVNQGTIDEGSGLTYGAPGQSFMVGASWLTPEKVGIGQLQPNARVQYVEVGDAELVAIDVGLGYIIDGYNNRWFLNFRHTGKPGNDDNALQIGAQLMM